MGQDIIYSSWSEESKSVSHSAVSDSATPVKDYGLPGSSVHGILQARIVELVAIPISRKSSWCWDETQVSCIVGGFFTVWATREASRALKEELKVLGFAY